MPGPVVVCRKAWSKPGPVVVYRRTGSAVTLRMGSVLRAGPRQLDWGSILEVRGPWYCKIEDNKDSGERLPGF